MAKTRKKLTFPSAYTVLFIVLILAAVLTYVIPAGQYSSLKYDEGADMFVITEPDGNVIEMAALFLISAIIIGIIGRMSEREIASQFIAGAADLVGVALVCGLARAVNYLLENGLISDTLLYTMSGWVEGMNPVLFVIVMMIVFIILGFFINSSSGLAMLSIPIMAPLADAVGLPRDIVISCYIYGLGLIGLITPTGLILAVLDMVDVTFNKWLKFCWPIMIIWTIFGMIMLLAQIYI